jgi:hypothetical protein
MTYNKCSGVEETAPSRLRKAKVVVKKKYYLSKYNL